MSTVAVRAEESKGYSKGGYNMGPHVVDVSEVSVVAYPMHGQWKLAAEGYRTRDGHFIEWFGKALSGQGSVMVVSRPEPAVLPSRSSWDESRVAFNTDPVRARSYRLPPVRSRQKWWVTSLNAYPQCIGLGPSTRVACWNPFLGLSSSWPALRDSNAKIVFDLLDDWTFHYAFKDIADSVVQAYEALFARADFVTANAEGTVQLAERFGRSDVQFIPNGCDPTRFSVESRASGPTTVGYVGKIGRRLDLELILEVCRKLPSVQFVFAGPVLDREYRPQLGSLPNVQMLGDVHYENVPALLETFDIGWVPHRVGEGEVGGDVIKTYEYRAAGLPVLTTPVAGAGKRSLDEVYVVDRAGHADWIAELEGQRVPRRVSLLPSDISWESKSKRLLSLLGWRQEEHGVV